jgi:hypothetical protein
MLLWIIVLNNILNIKNYIRKNRKEFELEKAVDASMDKEGL